MLWNDGASSRGLMVVDVMTARCVIEYETILFEEADDLARLDGGELWRHRSFISIAKPIKPAVITLCAEKSKTQTTSPATVT